jgi:pimeloyl-ACP methyl ester carboxylesterase
MNENSRLSREEGLMHTSDHPVVLVHGFWHGSWCWNPLIQQLANGALNPVAVDLEGHGLTMRLPKSFWQRPFDLDAYRAERSGVAHVTASSAATKLVEQLRNIGRGQPCVVIAHSMGGAIATRAAELAPELFEVLVYVSAFAPVAGVSSYTYLGSDEAAGSLIPSLLCTDPVAAGAARLDLGNPDLHPILRSAFYNDVDVATADAAIAMLGPDAPAGMSTEVFAVTRERFGSIPHAYITCGQDNMIPIALQQRFISEINDISTRTTSVHNLSASHSPFLSRPRELASIIESIAAPVRTVAAGAGGN